jgi:membrane protease YdiL (CAAX protease family)
MEKMIASLTLYALMLLVVIVSIGKWKNPADLLKKIGLKETNIKSGIFNAGAYLILLIIVSIIIGGIMVAFGFEEDSQIVSDILHDADFVSLLVVLSVASFVEEIFFRGYLQRKTNLLFASFVFGYFHIIYGSFSEIIGAFFLGLVLGMAYERTKNLFAPILAHFFYNLVVISLIFVTI